MLDQAKTVLEEQEYKVVALAPYATQVRALRDLGVEARTLSSFLAAPEKNLDARTVLVIDGAGTGLQPSLPFASMTVSVALSPPGA